MKTPLKSPMKKNTPLPFRESDLTPQAGKIILITGANTGIGFETARALAAKGARILLGCRSQARAEQARARIRDLHPEADVAIVQLDLADLSSVRDAAQKIQQEPQLDVIINNAGLLAPPRQTTKDGFEKQFGVNHLGHFALTGLLLNKIKRRRKTRKARIVTVSSMIHRLGAIDYDNIHAEKNYNPFQRYAMSKLANILFAYELQRRLAACGSQAISVACHPGAVGTDLLRHLPAWMTYLPVYKWVASSPAEGAWPVLLAATAQNANGGDYYGPSKRFETAGPAICVKSAPHSYDKNNARKLWELSEQLTGIAPSFE